jgi:hypothetical protein
MDKLLLLRREREMAAIARESGYYWILFNWKMFDANRDNEWQPAGWDAEHQTWVVIGSRQIVPFYEPCIVEVDEKRLNRSARAN